MIDSETEIKELGGGVYYGVLNTRSLIRTPKYVQSNAADGRSFNMQAHTRQSSQMMS